MDMAISPMPTQSEAAANLLGVPLVLPLVAIKQLPRRFPRSGLAYKNRANKSTPKQPDYLADVVLRLGEEDVDPPDHVLERVLYEDLHRGVRGRLDAQGGEEVPRELPPRQQHSEGPDERGTVKDHHDSPGEPP